MQELIRYEDMFEFLMIQRIDKAWVPRVGVRSVQISGNGKKSFYGIFLMRFPRVVNHFIISGHDTHTKQH